MGHARESMAVYRKSQDLISIGAYQPGSNPKIDEAISLHEPLREFLRQDTTVGNGRKESWEQLIQTLEQAQSAQVPEQPEAQIAPQQFQAQPQAGFPAPAPAPEQQPQPGGPPPMMA
jgi:hypothetical protein